VSAPVTFEVKVDAPSNLPSAEAEITSISPDTGRFDNDFLTNDKKPIIHGNIDAELNGDKLEIRIVKSDSTIAVDWTQVTVGAGLEWQYAIETELGDASYTIETRFVDASGNERSSGARTIEIDTIPPVETATLDKISDDTGVFSFADDFITIDKEINFTFKSTASFADNYYVQVKIGAGQWIEANYDNNGNFWSLNDILDVGAHDVQFRIVDAAGNAGSINSQTVTVLDYNAHSGKAEAQSLTVEKAETDLLRLTVQDGGADDNLGGNGHITINGFDTVNAWGNPAGSDQIDISALFQNYSSFYRDDYIKVAGTTLGGCNHLY